MEVGGNELTIYDNLHPSDQGIAVVRPPCRGPHIPTLDSIPSFKLMGTAAAYRRGSEKNCRSSGSTALRGNPRDAQRDYLHMLEEAEKGIIDAWASNLIYSAFQTKSARVWRAFHPKGGVIRREMGTTRVGSTVPLGYEFVGIPAHHQSGSV